MSAGPVITLERAWRSLMYTMSQRFIYQYSSFRNSSWALGRLTRHR